MAVLSRLANLVLRQVSAPAAPPAGSNVLYPKSDENLYTKDSAGFERNVQSVRPVRVATTGSITLSGTQTIDSVALAVDDLVLVHNQGVFSGNSYDNGVWAVKAGAWVRAGNADTAAKIAGAMFIATEGNYHRGQVFRCTFQSTQVLGTDPLGFVSTSSRFEIGGVFSQPKTADLGQAFFVAGERRLLVWDGTFFSNVKGVQNYGSVAPTFPATGELWYDSSDAGVTSLGVFAHLKAIAGQAITANTATALNLSVVDQAGSMTIGSNYIQVNQDGWYLLTGSVHWGNSVTSARRYLTFGIDAIAIEGSNPIDDVTIGAAYLGQNISIVRRLTAGMKVYLVVTTSVALSTQGDFTHLSVARVG